VLDAIQPTAVLTVGDDADPHGTLSQFMSCYEPKRDGATGRSGSLPETTSITRQAHWITSRTSERARACRTLVITVATGQRALSGRVEPNSEVRNTTAYGALKLRRHPTSHTWEFEPIAGQAFADVGSTSCH